MERIATIVLLIATVAGFYYGYVNQVESLNISTFQVPHDSYDSTATIVVSLDGTGSYDNEGDPIEFSWTVDPSSTEISSNDSELISFTAEPGEYTFTLTIKDSYGATTSVEHTVIVEKEINYDPSASIIAVLGDDDDLEREEEVVFFKDDTTAVESMAVEMSELEEKANSDSTTITE